MKKTLLNCLLTFSVLLASPFAQAAPLIWDANGTGAGQTDGVGTWLNFDQWRDGATNPWVADSNAIIGNSGTSGSINFNTFTGTYTLGSPGQALTINGGIN